MFPTPRIATDDRRASSVQLPNPFIHAYHKDMAYIRYIDEHDASADLRDLYDRHRDPAGHVDNILRVHGLNPPSLTGHVQLYRALMHGRSELSRIQREMIAVVVSAINQCHY